MTKKALQPNWSRIVGARGVKRRSGNFFRLSLFAVTGGLTALIVLPVCGELLISSRISDSPHTRITFAFPSLETNIFERRSHPAGGISPGRDFEEGQPIAVNPKRCQLARVPTSAIR